MAVAHKREKMLRRALANAVSSASLTQQRLRAARYLKSSQTRKLAVLRANSKLKLRYRVDLDKCMSIAKGMKAHKPSGERVHVRFKEKSSGGVRPICRFGIRNKALQCLLESVLSVSFSPQPWQYTFKGVHSCVKEIQGSQLSEKMWAKTLDIKEFYPNCTEPVIKGSIRTIFSGPRRNVLMSEAYSLRDKDGSFLIGDYLLQARRGIPQGSVISPLVGSMIVSQLDIQLDEGVRLFNYADDFLIIAPNTESLEKATHALDVSIDAVPGGQFHLETKSCTQLSDGFEFLGHDISLKDGELDSAPCATALARLEDRLEELYGDAYTTIEKEAGNLSIGSRTRVMQAIADYASFLRGWLKAFQMCDPAFLYQIRAEYNLTLEKLLELSGTTLDDIKPFIAELPDGYAYSMLSEISEFDSL